MRPVASCSFYVNTDGMIERMCDGTKIDHAQDFGPDAEVPVVCIRCTLGDTCLE